MYVCRSRIVSVGDVSIGFVPEHVAVCLATPGQSRVVHTLRFTVQWLIESDTFGRFEWREFA